MSLGVWAARFHWPNVALSFASVCFELFFPVVLFVPRLAPPLGGVCMHLGIYFTMKAPFFEMVAVFLVWVPFEKLFRDDPGTKPSAAP